MGKFFDELFVNCPYVNYLLRILLATILGFFIGYERKTRLKEAGIRTHTIVAVGSALFMIISKYAFYDALDWDGSRIASQIVSGVGFLGAGMIMHQRGMIHGLTTAAGVWATAGVGMAAAAGMWEVAIGATLIIIGIQCLFHINVKVFRMKRQTQLKVVFTADEGMPDHIIKLFQSDKFIKLQTKKDDNKIIATGILRTYMEVADDFIFRTLSENEKILSIEKSSDEE